jgi:RNA recognition motif-containing protein
LFLSQLESSSNVLVNIIVLVIMSKLFVYGINARCPRNIIEEEFGRCGEVTDVYNTEKGYAFVTMADEEAANNAVRTLNGSAIDGQQIKVDIARQREDRGGGGGGGMQTKNE